MARITPLVLTALVASLALIGCGGGGERAAVPPGSLRASTAPSDALPQPTDDPAADAFTRFNLRRQQLGVQVLMRSAQADVAARGHADYQKTNNTITHEQSPNAPGFTGVTVGDRLAAAGYQFRSAYAYGEVLSQTSDPSGINAAEDLIAAIYHRFVIFDPMFREAGVAAATLPRGPTYLTTNLVTDRLDGGLPAGAVVIYPVPGQEQVPRHFFSDQEVPDPVPDRNQVGYPVSVHANIISTVTVTEFSLRPLAGEVLPVRLLESRSDPLTPPSAASIVPLAPLDAGRTYEVRFVGAVDGTPVTRVWTFTTQ